MEYLKKSAELASAIAQTDEFTVFRGSRKMIEKNKYLRVYIEEYMDSLGEIYTSKAPPHELNTMITKLQKRYRDIARIPEIGAFIEASEGFNGVLSRTYKEIWDGVARLL